MSSLCVSYQTVCSQKLDAHTRTHPMSDANASETKAVSDTGKKRKRDHSESQQDQVSVLTQTHSARRVGNENFRDN